MQIPSSLASRSYSKIKHTNDGNFFQSTEFSLTCYRFSPLLQCALENKTCTSTLLREATTKSIHLIFTFVMSALVMSAFVLLVRLFCSFSPTTHCYIFWHDREEPGFHALIMISSCHMTHFLIHNNEYIMNEAWCKRLLKFMKCRTLSSLRPMLILQHKEGVDLCNGQEKSRYIITSTFCAPCVFEVMTLVLQFVMIMDQMTISEVIQIGIAYLDFYVRQSTCLYYHSCSHKIYRIDE